MNYAPFVVLLVGAIIAASAYPQSQHNEQSKAAIAGMNQALAIDKIYVNCTELRNGRFTVEGGVATPPAAWTYTCEVIGATISWEPVIISDEPSVSCRVFYSSNTANLEEIHTTESTAHIPIASFSTYDLGVECYDTMGNGVFTDYIIQ